MSDIFTRQEYLNASRENGADAHRRYYAQFVNDSTKVALLGRIQKSTILTSTKAHFNDIPLQFWDTAQLILAQPLKNAGDYLTAAGKVCILKEAALQIKESTEQ